MSRIAKSPINLPKGVDVSLDGENVTVKGAKGTLNIKLNALVELKAEEGVINLSPKNADDKASWAMAGTMRSIIADMVAGVSQGFERKLELVGVGYRAQAQGSNINLSLGFSHPVVYQLPDGVTAETPSNTEIVLKGIDKQALGQAAANIRAFRPPEPYKGKGVRFAGEQVLRKEAKKK